jgi:hypothetical protein
MTDDPTYVIILNLSCWITWRLRESFTDRQHNQHNNYHWIIYCYSYIFHWTLNIELLTLLSLFPNNRYCYFACYYLLVVVLLLLPNCYFFFYLLLSVICITYQSAFPILCCLKNLKIIICSGGHLYNTVSNSGVKIISYCFGLKR